ncbi:hypothetical protein ABZP36_024638 [Zizania latifolia]
MGRRWKQRREEEGGLNPSDRLCFEEAAATEGDEANVEEGDEAAMTEGEDATTVGDEAAAAVGDEAEGQRYGFFLFDKIDCHTQQ